MEEYEKYLDFAKEIAKEVGCIMKKYFDRRDVSSYKGDRPVAVFSLALVVVDGVSMLGVIYDPFTDNMYTAIKGKGAYQNDKNRNLTLIVRFLFFDIYK